MTKVILLLIGICILLIGCSTNFEDCRYRCRQVYDDKPVFQYEDICPEITMDELFSGKESRTYPCNQTDYDKLNEFCFNQCKDT